MTKELTRPMQPVNSLDNLYQLFRLGKVSTVIDKAETYLADPESRYQARLLQIRSLIIQGYFKEANKACKSALEGYPVDSVQAKNFRLWHAYVQVYMNSDTSLILKEARATLDLVQKNKEDMFLEAQAQYLLGTGIAIAVIWGLVPQDSLLEAQDILSQSINSYQQLYDNYEAIGALLKKGQIYLLGQHPELDAARVIFEQARNWSIESREEIRQAEAELRLAELEFDKTLLSDCVKPHIYVDFSLFERARSIYEANGHLLGIADVLLSLGRRQMNAGLGGDCKVRDAMKIYKQEDNLIGLSDTWSALGSWSMSCGNISEAINCHREALKVTELGGIPLGQATAQMAIGDYFYRTGDYARAKEAYEQAEKLAEFPAVQAMVGLALANTYYSMNLFDKAEVICRASINALIAAGPSDRLSLAYLILGNIFTGKGNWQDAIDVWYKGLIVDEALCDRIKQSEKLKSIAWAMSAKNPTDSLIPESDYLEIMKLYSQAMGLLIEAGDRESDTAIASIYQHMAQTAINYGSLQDALSYLEMARNIYDRLRLAMQVAFIDTMMGLIQSKLGSLEQRVEAEQYYLRALEYLLKEGMREITWKLRFYIADIAIQRGWLELTADDQYKRWKEAARYLDEAAKDIDFIRGMFIEADPVIRQYSLLGLVANKEQIYTTAIQLSNSYLKDPVSAFNWMERLKSRTFLDMLSITQMRSPALRDQSLLKREKELLDLMQKVSTQAEVVDLRESLHALWNKMEVDPAAKEYIAIRKGEPISWEEDVHCMLELGLEERAEVEQRRTIVLVEYFITKASVLILGLRSNFDEPDVVEIPFDYDNFRRFVTTNFGDQNRVHELIEMGLEGMWHNYDKLIAPISRWSDPGDIVYLIPHGLLHYLPLHALKLDGQYLIERNPVVYSPSASVLKYCQAKRKKNPENLSVFNSAAVFGDSRSNLPLARSEAEQVARLFNVKPLIGEDVTKDNFMKSIKGVDVVHFAGHAEFDSSQPLNSGLLLGGNEMLTARDIFRLDALNAYLVTLSGCETGINENNPGDELIGLTRAFLYAGTPSIIVSLWRVNDESAAFLMKQFYKYLQGDPKISKAFALQKAVLDTKAQQPWDSIDYWAPFVLIGDWQ